MISERLSPGKEKIMDSLYRRLLKFTKDGIYRYTFDDGKIIFANQGIVDIFELDMAPEELTGKLLSEVMVYTQKAGTIRQMLELHKEIHNFEYHFKTLGGKDKWVIHDSFIIESPDGIKIAEVIVRDITERKNNEINIFEEKERFRVTLSSIGDAVIVVDTDGKINLINQVAESLTGYGHDEAVGKPLNEVFRIINQNTRVSCENPVEKVLKNGKIVGLANHTALISKTGDEKIIADSGAPIYDKDGKIIGVILVFRDVTEQYNIEEALRESNEYLEKLLNHANAPIIVWDASSAITYFNHAFEQLSGYEAAEVISKKIDVIFPKDKINALLEQINNAAGGKRLESVEIEISRKDDEVRTVLWNFANILGKDGKAVIATIAQGQDITGRKLAERKVIELNATLEQRVAKRTAELELANKELEAFTYSVSHDLRAPLRHIDGYVNLMVTRCHDILNDKGLHYLETIADSARQMGILIDDLLQFSRTGRTEMHRTSADMNKALQETLSHFKDCAAGRVIEWNIADLPPVSGDYAMIRQVWANLLENAIKYTRKREVSRIKVSAREANEEIVFAVEDNGVGFDMKYAGKLFGVFQRMHSSEEFEGTGIGLATVKRIINRHGGRIWAEAEPDKGASFFFTLPKSKEKKHV